jgi:hypothetical protein
MIWANGNFHLLQDNYLFSMIARKVKDYQAANPGVDIIPLGIGDVTLPLPPASIKAMHAAVDEMGKPETFKGYRSDSGYEFLRQAISVNDYKPLGANIDIDEIFISDGAKNDTANFTNVFDGGNIIAITDSGASPLNEYASHVLVAHSNIASFVDSLVAPFSIANAFIVAIGLQKRQEASENFMELERIWDEYNVYIEKNR